MNEEMSKRDSLAMRPYALVMQFCVSQSTEKIE